MISIRKIADLPVFLLYLAELAFARVVSRFDKNCGDRGGFDCQTMFPENSIELLEFALQDLQHSESFKYLEIDIQETHDAKLVLFQDEKIGRLVPNVGQNKPVFQELFENIDFVAELEKKYGSNLPLAQDLEIEDIKWADLKRLLLGAADEEQLSESGIPLLEDYLVIAGDLDGKRKVELVKPLVLEIKNVVSTPGKESFLNLISTYKSRFHDTNPSFDDGHTAFPYHMIAVTHANLLRKLMPEKDDGFRFCQALKKLDVNTYSGFGHYSLCDFEYRNQRTKHYPVIRFFERIMLKFDVQDLQKTYDPRLFTSHKTGAAEYLVSETPRALNYITTHKNKNSTNLLLYVHGRGRHPAKGLKILKKLEKQYSANVLMFDWDAWIANHPALRRYFPWSTRRPSGNAKDAAKNLHEFLMEVSRYQNDNPGEFTHVSLLVHSMGNIVLKAMINQMVKSESGLSDKFIDALILNSADVDLESHADWVERIEFARNSFITMTRGDMTLATVEITKYKTRLGQDYILNTGEDARLSAKAHYLDMTEATRGHRKFLNRDKYVGQFFRNVFEGNRWHDELDIENTEPGNIIEFKSLRL